MKKKEDWDIVIKPGTRLFTLNLKEVWNYRDLLMLFVRRDFVAEYKQTILGPIWYIIQPLATSFIWFWALGKKAGISTDGLHTFLFFLCGQALWMYFADCLNKTADTFIANARLFGKVYFPRLIVPMSVIISNLIKFGLQFLILVVAIIYFHFTDPGYQFAFHSNLLILPLPIMLIAGLSFSFGILITSLTTKYRDLKFVLKFGVQLLMVGSAVIFPLSAAPILKWNPIACIMELFRSIIFNHQAIMEFYIWYPMVFLVSILGIGIVVFNSTEKNFMDTV